MGEIIPVTKNDISGRRTDATHKIEDFVGVVAQSVVDVNDNYRLHIMDGATRGGHPVAMLDSANDFTKPITVLPIEDLVFDSDEHDTTVPNIGDTKKLIEERVDAGLENKIDHTILVDGANVNELISDGIYYVTNGTNTANLTSGMLHVYANGTTIIQVWIECSTAEPKQVFVYYRFKAADTVSFTSWFRILNSKDVDLENVAYVNKENTFSENQEFSGDVNIAGTLTGPTIESKIDHTKAITIDDMDNLIEDGHYQISAATTNLPSEASLPCYVIVFSDKAFILQVVFSINGYIYSRAKQGDSFSAWTGGDIDFPEATLEQKGIVQLTNIISELDESHAITPKAVHGVQRTADYAKTQADSNQKAITALASTVNDININYIKTVNVPSGADGVSATAVLPVSGNAITIPIATDAIWGFTRAASDAEISSGTSTNTYVSPAKLDKAVSDKVAAAVEDLENTGDLLTVEVVTSGSATTKDNTIYFVVE